MARQLAEQNKRAAWEAQQREAEAKAREEESKRQEEEARKVAYEAQKEEERVKRDLAQTKISTCPKESSQRFGRQKKNST